MGCCGFRSAGNIEPTFEAERIEYIPKKAYIRMQDFPHCRTAAQHNRILVFLTSIPSMYQYNSSIGSQHYDTLTSNKSRMMVRRIGKRWRNNTRDSL